MASSNWNKTSVFLESFNLGKRESLSKKSGFKCFSANQLSDYLLSFERSDVSDWEKLLLSERLVLKLHSPFVEVDALKPWDDLFVENSTTVWDFILKQTLTSGNNLNLKRNCVLYACGVLGALSEVAKILPIIINKENRSKAKTETFGSKLNIRSQIKSKYSQAAFELANILLSDTTIVFENYEPVINIDSAHFKSPEYTPQQSNTRLFVELLNLMQLYGTATDPTGALNRRYFIVVHKLLLLENIPPILVKFCFDNVIKLLIQNTKIAMQIYSYDIIKLAIRYENKLFFQLFQNCGELFSVKKECTLNESEVNYLLSVPFDCQSSVQISAIGTISNGCDYGIATLLNYIAKDDPVLLFPYVENILVKLSKLPIAGAVALQLMTCLRRISSLNPEIFLPHIPQLVDFICDQNVENVVDIIAVVATVEPPKSADEMFAILLSLLRTHGTSSLVAKQCVLKAINNIKSQVSSKEIILNDITAIKRFLMSDAVIVQSIVDYANGLTLELLALKVDEMDAKVTYLNGKLQSCVTFDELNEVVTQNIAEVKEFVGVVTRKLPLPKRLEVVGSLRKTLILHFECSRTGLEFPVHSRDWHKWLKMGYGLIMAGKMAIDIGKGDPLGLIESGINSIKQIYTAYKSNDDDDFQTYISNPFLTSAEQDGLLLQLRKLNFFTKMAYDSQTGGWYLVNPAEDGVEPGMQTDVSHLSSKVGYGIVDDLTESMKSMLPTASKENKNAKKVKPKGKKTLIDSDVNARDTNNAASYATSQAEVSELDTADIQITSVGSTADSDDDNDDEEEFRDTVTGTEEQDTTGLGENNNTTDIQQQQQQQQQPLEIGPNLADELVKQTIQLSLYHTSRPISVKVPNLPFHSNSPGAASTMTPMSPSEATSSTGTETVSSYNTNLSESIRKTCSGYMTKQGSFFKTWKKRYFVLDDCELTYFKNPADKEAGKPVGTPFILVRRNIRIPSTIHTATKVEHNATELSIDLILRPSTIMKNGKVTREPGRTLKLRLDSNEDFNMWKEAIEEHLADDDVVRTKRANELAASREANRKG